MALTLAEDHSQLEQAHKMRYLTSK